MVAFSSSKPVVAILEDHDDTREMLRVGLQPDFSTQVFRNGGELLSSLEGGKFSAIIADIMMPGMDGFRFIETIRSDPRFKSLCVIAVTALAMPPDRDKGLTAGFTDYLVKPVTPQEIKAVICRYLSEPGGSSAA